MLTTCEEFYFPSYCLRQILWNTVNSTHRRSYLVGGALHKLKDSGVPLAAESRMARPTVFSEEALRPDNCRSQGNAWQSLSQALGWAYEDPALRLPGLAGRGIYFPTAPWSDTLMVQKDLGKLLAWVQCREGDTCHLYSHKTHLLSKILWVLLFQFWRKKHIQKWQCWWSHSIWPQIRIWSQLFWFMVQKSSLHNIHMRKRPSNQFYEESD